MASLKKLSNRNQNLLCASSYYINSFKRVVEELVYNSLDADSTSIAIRVCIENKYIQVLDNGIGIIKDNFRLLGDKYVTNKFIDDSSLKSTSNKYGYKGIYLASIIEVSENVKISSKFKNSQETWMKVFCKGSVEDFNLTSSRPSKGTTVEISGFLYNHNIQQKSIDLLNEINSIKLVLEQLSLVHCNVSFSLRDDSKNEIIFKIHKNRNIYQTLLSLFEISMNDLKDLQVEKNQYKVKAYIGKNCLVPKKYQWVFLNGRQTIVEFKNCEAVNKLIEKLINLYYGDIKGKPIIVRKEINQDNNNDTRRKVKEIMDKILNKNEVKANMMQLQNGIIGKNVKRKLKKRNMNDNQQNILEKETEYNSLCKIKESANFIERDKKHGINELSESHKSVHNLLKNNRLKNKYFNNNNNNNNRNLLKAKNYRRTKKNIEFKIKTNASIEPLIQKFEHKTETVQKRCQKLSVEAQTILNRKYFNNIKILKANGKHGKDFKIDSPKEKYIKSNNVEHLSTKQVKTTYDLLKINENKEKFPINVFTDTQNTVIAESIVSDKKILSTFNSHEINKRIIPKCSIHPSKKYLPNLNPMLYEYSYTEKNQPNNRLNLWKSPFLKELQMSTNLSLSNHIKKTSPSIEDAVTSKDTHTNIENDISIFKPKSQYSDEIEPLKFCESILNSTEMRNIEQEFNKSFFHNEKSNLIMTSDNNFTRVYNNFDNFGKNEFVNIFKDKNQKDQFIYNTVQRETSNIELYEKSRLDKKQPSLPIFSSQAHNTEDFKLKGRHRFVPKGMSQIFEGHFKKNSDYNNDEEYYEDAIYNHFAEDVRDKFEIFEPCVKNVKDIFSKDLNKINYRTDKDNADLIFNSESLKQAQILGQVDKKFIAARIQSRCSSDGKSSYFLTLFDQHAVDERVRLERNLSDYFDGIKWKSVAFETFQLKLSRDDYFYLYNYKDKFTQFGLQWTFAEKHVLIHAIPEAILGKNPRKAETIITAIKNFISEQIEIIKSIRGNVYSYPKCIMELVFSEACRYAIKFGDHLSKDDCVNIIGALADCKTPFQCAHGRPVMAIMMEIPNNNYIYKVNISRLKEFKKIMS
ncbi:metacaspase-3-like [Nymphalis io]|uniref:metacaspase-3-like n=1 Tax=Inachis io TaxID=171585 RepID=UPI00216A1375|nr:metacaspase-3-like [Nymphalis io]